MTDPVDAIVNVVTEKLTEALRENFALVLKFTIIVVVLAAIGVGCWFYYSSVTNPHATNEQQYEHAIADLTKHTSSSKANPYAEITNSLNPSVPKEEPLKIDLSNVKPLQIDGGDSGTLPPVTEKKIVPNPVADKEIVTKPNPHQDAINILTKSSIARKPTVDFSNLKQDIRSLRKQTDHAALLSTYDGVLLVVHYYETHKSFETGKPLDLNVDLTTNNSETDAVNWFRADDSLEIESLLEEFRKLQAPGLPDDQAYALAAVEKILLFSLEYHRSANSGRLSIVISRAD